MKKLYVFLLIISSINIYSQVCVGSADYFNEKSKTNKQADIDRFKNNKIIFVLPDKYTNEEYSKIISESWKITNFEIINTEEFEKNTSKYKKVSNVIAEFSGYVLTTTYSGSSRVIKSTEHIFFTLNFYIVNKVTEKKKKTLYDITSLASVFFTLDYPQMREDNIKDLVKAKPKYLYNFNLGYLKNYLQKINNDLSSNKNFNCFDEFIDEEKLKELKTKKLIFTDEIVRVDVTLGSRQDRNINELLSEYKYDYEVVTIDELNKRILNNEEFYYFTYSQINAKKILTITNSKTGEVIYNYMNRMSYTIKEKDFKQVSKEIEKSK